MAIAVFSDIHGNLEALEAILKHIKKNRKIKEVYYLGDAITFGPDSEACLKTLRASNVKCVLGNHEQRAIRYDRSVNTMTYVTAKHMQHVFMSLDNDDLQFLKSIPLEIKINYKGRNILFTHYAHDEKGIVRDDYNEHSESQLNKLFGEKNCDVVFYGHTHQRNIVINESRKSYVCVGSSGCVKGDKTFYTYFDINDDMGDETNCDIYRVDIRFNRKRFDEKLSASTLPDKDKYIPHCFN